MNTRMMARINRFYDERMYHQRLSEYYGYTHFFNYGYWDEKTQDQKTACENLVEKLLFFLPSKRGRILDVACGKGAVADYLLRYYKPQDVTGINISQKQLETCRVKIPKADFLLMDGANLEFENNSFDNIICVEAVFHFNSRVKFIEEAYRVLKPGGCLALTDILLTEWGKRQKLWWIDNNNADLNDLNEYREIYRRAGFQSVDIIDATRECWEEHSKSLARHSYEKLLAREIDITIYNQIAARILRMVPFIRYYLLVAARKELPDKNRPQ